MAASVPAMIATFFFTLLMESFIYKLLFICASDVLIHDISDMNIIICFNEFNLLNFYFQILFLFNAFSIVSLNKFLKLGFNMVGR